MFLLLLLAVVISQFLFFFSFFLNDFFKFLNDRINTIFYGDEFSSFLITFNILSLLFVFSNV